MSFSVGVRTAVVAVVALLFGSPYFASRTGAQGPQSQRFEGNLLVVWGDPHPDAGRGGETRFILSLPDGRDLPLEMAGRENEALAHFGKPVVVTGRLASRAPRAAGAPFEERIAVDAIAPVRSPSAATATQPEAAVLGSKRVIFVLLKFAGDTNTPHPASFYTNLTNPDTPPAGQPFTATINGFFKKVSGNQFSWIGDVAPAGGDGWLTLPQPKSYYANCSFGSTCLNFTRINTDSVNVAKAAGVNFGLYDNVNFVYNNDLDCCAWGGTIAIDGRVLGATWEPPWGQNTPTYGHEMGHSLGLPHSGWTYFSYDSPWDIMSAIRSTNAISCGSYVSANSGGTRGLACDEPGDGYIAPHRDFLGWLPGGTVVTTNTTSSTTVTLEGAALPIGSSPKMIKICLPGLPCTGSSARYFSVEARVRGLGTTSQFDNAIPGDGVIIHDVQLGRQSIFGGCYFNSQSGWAVPVDATPGDYNPSTCSGTGLNNAQFLVGQTYTNTTYGFRVIVVSRAGSSFVVQVQSLINTEMAFDTPVNGSTVTRPFTVQGWAINRTAASGTGVDMVHVYATPAGGSPIFLGQATYGSARGDVGALFGAQFTNSGWALVGAGGSLAAGNYTVTAYARNATSGIFDAALSVSVTVPAPTTTPFIALDTPAPSQVVTSAFEVGGWALDAGATTGTGVDSVQFYVHPNAGAAPGVFIGTGSYGSSRADVAAIFGSRFTNCGFHFTITGLGPGDFVLSVRARSTVTGTYSIVKLVPFTVNANALMSIDVPSAESTISASAFAVSGWSLDRQIEAVSGTGTGVDTLHVYAYPNPGSGQAPIFLGVADIGMSRPDVAALYGSRYTNCGYTLVVSRAASGLSPGVYNIVVHSHSAATGSFNNVALVRVTLQ